MVCMVSIAGGVSLATIVRADSWKPPTPKSYGHNRRPVGNGLTLTRKPKTPKRKARTLARNSEMLALEDIGVACKGLSLAGRVPKLAVSRP